MRTFDVKFKQKVGRAYLSGKGEYKILAAKFDIADSLVRKWIGAYQHHGSAGLVRQRGRYTCEFKLEVLRAPRITGDFDGASESDARNAHIKA